MKADMCSEFDLVNSRSRSFGKREKNNEFEQNGSRKSDFKKLNEVPSMRRCLCVCSNREVAMYQ
jgi:hypothetical protein